METTKRTPKERRYDAIGHITHKYVDSNTGLLKVEDTRENRIMIGNDITALWQFGRTARWTAAVTDWCDMVVSTQENPGPDGLRWAILQGAIFTGFKA